MSINVRERMRERDWEKGKGVGRRGNEMAVIVAGTWPGADRTAAKDCPASAGPDLAADMRRRSEGLQAAPSRQETAGSCPRSLFPHSRSRCVQPTRQPRAVNSRLSHRGWRLHDSAAPSNSLHTSWHLRRRTRCQEPIETCPFHGSRLARCSLPGPCIGHYAAGEALAALIPGRVGRLASHRGKFLLSSRQIAVAFV